MHILYGYIYCFYYPAIQKLMKRERGSLNVRCLKITGFGRIPLDICWRDNHHNLDHVHNLKCAKVDQLGNPDVKAMIKCSKNPRWCGECVRGYTQSTPDSRAFFEVVRLNGNEFAGNLPPEIILKIYEELVNPKLEFTECLVRKPTE